MYLIPGVVKEDYSDYVLYFVENLSDELKSLFMKQLNTKTAFVNRK